MMLIRGPRTRGAARSISGRLGLTVRWHPLTFTRGLLFQGAPIDLQPEVEDALTNGRPVVALESTIITHGMPYPTSLEMAQSVEEIIRSTGSTPATIGLIEGRVKIGLEPGELKRLASRSADPVKLSRRDIGAAVALRRDGGTTCSSTLIFAALAGIKVFATGGLGGVHRGGENTMDVSADLHELSRCPVGLVSAGVKSILDIGRTLEYLETLGVPVVSYAESNDFPAFYTRKSGFESPWNIDDPETAARMLYTQKQFGMSNGVLFAVPIPERYEAIGTTLQEAVETAIRESEEAGVSKLGKEVTPWLLKRVGELTCGKSLESNIALVQNTALVGGRIAAEYAKIAKESGNGQNRLDGSATKQSTSAHVEHANSSRRSVANPASGDAVPELSSFQKASVVVVGCAAVDITSQPQAATRLDHKTTWPGKVSVSLGGVARNIAEAAHRVMSGATGKGVATLLVAPVGDDAFGSLITDLTESLGMRTDGLVSVHGQRSSVCNLLLDAQGQLQSGVADMDLMQVWKADQILPILKVHHPQLLGLDGNISSETLSTLVTESLKAGIQIFFEPTSVVKSSRLFPAVAANLGKTARPVVSFVSPNLVELAQMYQDARTTYDLMSHDHWWSAVDSFGLGSQFCMDLAQLAKREISDTTRNLGTLSFIADKGVVQMAVNLLPFFQHLVIKCGELGVLVIMRLNKTKASAWAMERSNPCGRYIIAHSQYSDEIVVIHHFPPLQVAQEVTLNTTGAGDSLVGALLAVLAQNPRAFDSPVTLTKALDIAQQAAILTLQSPYAVSRSLSSLRSSSTTS
ncbi:indigoidine synthase A-like protein [Gyrodon lividus]|nr:indigoidine synthase A-like protein [Gyrodon lividus]